MEPLNGERKESGYVWASVSVCMHCARERWGHTISNAYSAHMENGTQMRFSKSVAKLSLRWYQINAKA